MGPRQEPLSDALTDALAEVWSSVVHLRQPKDLEGWHVVAREAKERILSRRRQDLTPQDLHDYVEDGPNELPLPEAQWFLPALCEHIARGEHCRGALGWSFALSLLPRSGFPERWPDRPVAAVRAFVAALVTDYLEHPDA